MVGTSRVIGYAVSIQSVHVCVYSVFTGAPVTAGAYSLLHAH